MTNQNDIKKLAEQMAGSMSSFDDIKAAHAILYRYRS